LFLCGEHRVTSTSKSVHFIKHLSCCQVTLILGVGEKIGRKMNNTKKKKEKEGYEQRMERDIE
jgi:hypothetical protein